MTHRTKIVKILSTVTTTVPLIVHVSAGKYGHFQALHIHLCLQDSEGILFDQNRTIFGVLCAQTSSCVLLFSVVASMSSTIYRLFVR